MTPTEDNKARPRLLSRTIVRSLILSFLLIALIPLSILGYRVYHAAWDSAWREIHEKHRLLAMNLASPISIYVNDHRAMLRQVASTLKSQTESQRRAGAAALLESNVEHLKDFRSLILIDDAGRLVASASEQGVTVLSVDDSLFRDDVCYRMTMEQGQSTLSGIKPSPLDGKPAIHISQPLNTEDGGRWVLLGELRTEVIEELRRNIQFGKNGHSAIVDQFGHVIAHPNPEWAREMRDLSHIPIVKKMMAGETGVTEFYSPFIKANMVAGYTSVPGIGWGIMVPQPKSEVEEQVSQLLHTQFGWGMGGLLIAGVLGLTLARWIATPINGLADAAHKLVQNQFRGNIPRTDPGAPYEILKLSSSMTLLVNGLQKSRAEVENLNESLQLRVDEATQQLREANQRLEQLAQQDHLTKLSNRRHFEAALERNLGRRREDSEIACILLIDVDHFKAVNDRYGHAAGDRVLLQMARLLEEAMRQHDVVSRYGGDEFAAYMSCDAETGRQRAQQILTAVRNSSLAWDQDEIRVTVSIGLFHGNAHQMIDVDTVLRHVDGAMYQAKRGGRDRVMEFSL